MRAYVQAAGARWVFHQTTSSPAFLALVSQRNLCFHGRHRTWHIHRSPVHGLGPSHMSNIRSLLWECIHTHHRAVCYQPNERSWWQEAEAHNKRVLQSLQTVLFLTRVNDVEEDRRRRCWTGEPILDRSTLRMQLRGYRILSNVFVVRWESVAGKTEGTYPKFCPSIHSTYLVSTCQHFRLQGIATHAKGFNTALQGCLQVSGSYWSRGVSGFSFNGVYKAPIGTTKRLASLTRSTR